MRRFFLALPLAVAVACSSSSDDGGGGPTGAVDGGGNGGAMTTNDSGGSPILDSGGGPIDAGGDAFVDPCKDKTICDSFESFTVGQKPGAPWTALESSGTVTVSDTRAHTGTKSVKMATTMNQYQQAMIQISGAPMFPAANNTVYGKMWVYLENAAAHDVHWNMLSAGGPVPGKSVNAVYDYGGQLDVLLALYYTDDAKNDCGAHSKQGMPIGKWTCFAWAQKGPTNEMQLFDSNGEITDMHITNGSPGGSCVAQSFGGMWLAPTFQKASVGWESVQTDVGHTMYVDDVTFDDQPLSCP